MKYTWDLTGLRSIHRSDLPHRVFQRSDEQELRVDAERRHVAGDLLAVAVQPVPRREAQHVLGPVAAAGSRRRRRDHRRPGARGGEGDAPGPRRYALLRVARVPEKFPVGQLKLNWKLRLSCLLFAFESGIDDAQYVRALKRTTDAPRGYLYQWLFSRLAESDYSPGMR